MKTLKLLTGTALIGLAAALCAGPALLVPAAVGALVGGLAAKLRDSGFSDARLKALGENLKPGSSAIVAVVEHRWVAEVEKAMAEAGAEAATAAIGADIATQLEAGHDVAYTAISSEEGFSAARVAAGERDDAQIFVDEHNRYRADHCAPPLKWSDKLAKVAQSWADQLRDAGCAFDHSKSPYGENLAMGTSGAMPPETVVCTALTVRIAPSTGPMHGVQPAAKAIPSAAEPNMPRGLFSFSLRRSVRSLLATLPTNSTRRILILGPSAMLKVTFTSFGPPATGVTVWLTSAFVKPFSAIISRSTVSTRRMVPGSRNESSRISMPRMRSCSSILVRSISFVPW